MNKDAPRVPVMLLLILFVLIIGILIIVQMSKSTDKGTFKKVENVRQYEKNLYENTPGGEPATNVVE